MKRLSETPIVLVGSPQGITSRKKEIILLKRHLSDTEMLRAMAQPESPTTLQKACDALIAETMLVLGVRDGSPMVAPITSVVLRNIEEGSVIGGGETLASLRGALENAEEKPKRFVAGLNLGDRGAHMAAGWVGSRSLRRQIGDRDLLSYSMRSAATGYRAALGIAETGKSFADFERMLRLLIERLDILVTILESLTSEKRRKILDLIKKTRAKVSGTAEWESWTGTTAEG